MDIYKVVVFTKYKKYIKKTDSVKIFGPIVPLVKLKKVGDKYKWVFVKCVYGRSFCFEINKNWAKKLASENNCGILYKKFKLVKDRKIRTGQELINYEEGDI